MTKPSPAFHAKGVLRIPEMTEAKKGLPGGGNKFRVFNGEGRKKKARKEKK